MAGAANLQPNSNEPCRRILTANDIDMWLHSEGYRDYLNFIKQLNEFAKGVHNNSCTSRSEITNINLTKVVDLLDKLDEIATQIEPFNDDKDQRFGNKAYRVWFDRMVEYSQTELKNIFGEKDGSEMALYLVDSFGNKVRIDYGTGHEMCFLIFLMGVYKLALIPEALNESLVDDGETLSRNVFKSLSHQLLVVYVLVYMPMVRKIQLRYRLEPAGSHGAFSLDDFQFLPFYFGSAQLIQHPTLDPGSFPQAAIAEQYKDEYIFYAAVSFIHQVKKGPFAEHSNQLWNISGVDDWAKINNGLFKMYCKEYLPKFQIDEQDGIYLSKVEYKWLDGETASPTDVSNTNRILYKFEYHIIYSSSYQVPTIFFNISDQRGCIVSLDWIWNRLPEHIVHSIDDHDKLFNLRGQMITQVMHPITGSPYFTIHPCRTSQLMGQFYSDNIQNSNHNYLITWLSCMAPIVGLSISNEFGRTGILK
ncbi:hypothetical protein RDWZM_003346 [Blomia tropicalis]|uniref:Serine/threonine-protein phosphatase 2A activator n=1 Tax=Blomia tropicalis TaxID=40697 RepID=A0A9Q0RSY6_BLOTA|nr:hypothetical protein RDWZM_003346 [Blomia tropicalis]